MPELNEEALAQRIIDGARDAIIFADRDGIIRLWNTGAEAIFGYGKEEALGRSLDLIVPERFRERHWAGYHRVMASGEAKYGSQLLSVPAVRKDGERISIEFTVSLIHGSGDELVGIAAVVRDITARWKEERALKERLAQLEAKAAGKDRDQ